MIMFQFCSPTKIVFGTGSLNKIREELPAACKSILLVTGKKSMEERGVVGRIAGLAGNGVKVHIYNKVYNEPDVNLIDDGLEFARSREIELVIGLGGGSAVDTAKAIAGLYRISGFKTTAEWLDIDGTKKLGSPGIPLIAVPTVSGSGAEVTNNSVIVNRKLNTKRSFRSKYLFARTAIVDPELTMTLPREITASSGIDALSHLVEGYVSKKSNPVSDALALKGIELARRSLAGAVKDGGNIEYRQNLALASVLGGMVIVSSGLGLAHGMGPFIGLMYGVPHGTSVGMLLPYVMEFNLSTNPAKFRDVAVAMGNDVKNVSDEQAAFMAVKAVKDMIDEIRIKSRLSQIGAKPEDFQVLAEKTLTSSSTKKNPRDVSKETVLKILKKAF